MDTSTDAMVGFDEGYRVGIYEFAYWEWVIMDNWPIKDGFPMFSRAMVELPGTVPQSRFMAYPIRMKKNLPIATWCRQVTVVWFEQLISASSVGWSFIVTRLQGLVTVSIPIVFRIPNFTELDSGYSGRIYRKHL